MVGNLPSYRKTGNEPEHSVLFIATTIFICVNISNTKTRLYLSYCFQLFDLLGFDRFELIQSLLENRRSLVKNVALEATREAILQAPSEFFFQFFSRESNSLHRFF